VFQFEVLVSEFVAIDRFTTSTITFREVTTLTMSSSAKNAKEQQTPNLNHEVWNHTVKR
jgi:hypothetical protein